MAESLRAYVFMAQCSKGPHLTHLNDVFVLLVVREFLWGDRLLRHATGEVFSFEDGMLRGREPERPESMVHARRVCWHFEQVQGRRSGFCSHIKGGAAGAGVR